MYILIGIEYNGYIIGYLIPILYNIKYIFYIIFIWIGNPNPCLRRFRLAAGAFGSMVDTHILVYGFGRKP